ncbi:hypothetical protein DFP72DRAFT_851869 [Ephemerocybe angulata]|uniref:Uncharacterized protein n=1 Tax=Ephemerocybe angulata TaxID=980116 RepID=A0A8H6HPW1_9AGAR|nr:hypothetical protein DFP72DRAFT_851869 [Tulosesus angulatus]
MPVQRVSGHTPSGSRQGTKRVNTPTTPRRAKSFGAHSDGHPVLKTIATKDAARMAVNTLLKEAALHVAAPRPVDSLRPHHLGHPVTPPMVYYANNLDNFGRWYQVCKENCNTPKFLTASPARATIWDNDEIVRLFLIREELFPTPRGIPSAQKSKEIARHKENLNRLEPYHEHLLKDKPQGTDISSDDIALPVSTPTISQAPVFSLETRPSAQPHPMMKDFGKRVEEPTPRTASLYKPSGNVFYWDERDSCIQANIQPDESGFIRLSAHRIHLGEAQIELLYKVERYIFEYEAWKPFPLDMPIGPIEGSGYPILIRKVGVEKLHNFNDMLDLTRIDHKRILKGKGRAIPFIVLSGFVDFCSVSSIHNPTMKSIHSSLSRPMYNMPAAPQEKVHGPLASEDPTRDMWYCMHQRGLGDAHRTVKAPDTRRPPHTSLAPGAGCTCSSLLGGPFIGEDELPPAPELFPAPRWMRKKRAGWGIAPDSSVRGIEELVRLRRERAEPQAHGVVEPVREDDGDVRRRLVVQGCSLFWARGREGEEGRDDVSACYIGHVYDILTILKPRQPSSPRRSQIRRYPPSTNSTSAFSLVVMLVEGSRGSLRNCQSAVNVKNDGVESVSGTMSAMTSTKVAVFELRLFLTSLLGRALISALKLRSA